MLEGRTDSGQNGAMKMANWMVLILAAVVFAAGTASVAGATEEETDSIFVFAGCMTDSGKWENSEAGPMWVPKEQCWVLACLDRSLHDEISREIERLPFHELDDFIAMYPTPEFFLWVVDGRTGKLLAWHSLKKHDFCSYVCEARIQVIFPDTKFCLAVVQKMAEALDSPLTEEQQRHVPTSFQIAKGNQREDMKARFAKMWQSMEKQPVEEVKYWFKAQADLTSFGLNNDGANGD